MKHLLDENLSHRLVARLQGSFADSAHVDDVGLHGRLDTAIWDYASRYGFVVVSKDDDFRQLSFLRGHPPKVNWLVEGNCGSNQIAKLLLRSQTEISILMDRTEQLWFVNIEQWVGCLKLKREATT